MTFISSLIHLATFSLALGVFFQPYPHSSSANTHPLPCIFGNYFLFRHPANITFHRHYAYTNHGYIQTRSSIWSFKMVTNHQLVVVATRTLLQSNRSIIAILRVFSLIVISVPAEIYWLLKQIVLLCHGWQNYNKGNVDKQKVSLLAY